MTQEELEFITNGNVQAADFVNSYLRLCHLLDDVVDSIETVTDERLVEEVGKFIEVLIMNPWARDNGILLLPLIVAGANAWVDSNRLAKREDIESKAAADVLKGMYHETVWFVAKLCGGQEHYRKVTTQLREYDFDYKLKD